MLELVWDEAFKKALKKWNKKHPDLVERFTERLNLFTQEPYHPSLKTHQLSGTLKEYWALSVTYDYRLVFKFLAENKVLLIDLGTHDEVY